METQFNKQYEVFKHAAGLFPPPYRCLWTATYLLVMDADGEQLAGIDYQGDNKYKVWAISAGPLDHLRAALALAQGDGWGG
ncbi:MAG: hypothetical protein HUU34_16290 [Saprospiraceae bacterium]|nr:hypothetical protein [Saprospiraceae bacterium]